MNKRLFGTIDGKQANLYTLSNSFGMSVSVTNYGCAVQSLCVPDRARKSQDVVMGFDGLKDYIGQRYYIGTAIGRCANRIKGAVFSLDGREYALSANEAENHLHGGYKGFHDRLWETEYEGENQVIFRYLSPDGEEGYPGTLDVRISYELTAENSLVVQYHAISDADTIVNLTNHSYFNLEGHAAGTIEQHTLQVNANAYTEIDESCIPTGVIAPVKGTPLDFKKPVQIGERLGSAHIQMKYGSGYNHNFVLGQSRQRIKLAAVLTAPASGVRMKVFTTEPGLQFYTGNYLNGDITGKGGAIYPRYAALCFETQGFPNAVNNAHFPSVILQKDLAYTSKTVFAFDTIQ